jgi:hypothetical protein
MRKPPLVVIHINFLPGELLLDPRRIWMTLHAAVKKRKIFVSAGHISMTCIEETALFLGQRDYILRACFDVLKGSLKALAERVPDISQIEEVNGYRTMHGEQLFKDRDAALLAVDSVLFEIRAYLDILANFAYAALKLVDRAPNSHEKLRSGKMIAVLTKRGVLQTNAFLRLLCDKLSLKSDWFEFLSQDRNFFTHEGAPYIAIEPVTVLPQELEFIIMRRNIHDFSEANPTDYFRLSELTDVLQNLRKVARGSERYLLSELEAVITS